VDVVIGDGANSRIAKEIDARDYNYAIAFQEQFACPKTKWHYNELAEMYVGTTFLPISTPGFSPNTTTPLVLAQCR